MSSVLVGEIPVRHGTDAAMLLRVLVDVARLEMGEHTHASVVAHLTGPALAQRLRDLQPSGATEAARDVATLEVGGSEAER